MGRVSLDGREGEGQQMTLLAVEVAVALFQQYAMSSAEECVPCSPGRVTELITQRARGGTGAAGGRKHFPAWPGGSRAPAQPQPRGRRRRRSRPRACVACKGNAAPSLCGPEGVACVVLQNPAHLSKGC